MGLCKELQAYSHNHITSNFPQIHCFYSMKYRHGANFANNPSGGILCFLDSFFCDVLIETLPQNRPCNFLTKYLSRNKKKRTHS